MVAEEAAAEEEDLGPSRHGAQAAVIDPGRRAGPDPAPQGLFLALQDMTTTAAEASLQNSRREVDQGRRLRAWNVGGSGDREEIISASPRHPFAARAEPSLNVRNIGVLN